MKETTFRGGIDIACSNGEVAKALAFHPFGGVATDNGAEFLDNVLGPDGGLVEFIQP